MSSLFPTSLQDLDATRGNASDPTSAPDHAAHHHLEDDTIEALQAKVGIDNSADATSLDYKLKNTSSVDPGHKHTHNSITMALANLTDVELTALADGNGLIYDLASGKFKNATTTTADASTTVKGVAKVSVAPVSPTAPIAVGDNDGRVPTQNENDALVGTSGTAVSSSNKLVDNADTSTTKANSKIPRANSSGKIDSAWIDANDFSNGLYAFGAATDLNTTSLSNNDQTITLGFQPRLIILDYFIQGHDSSAGGTGYRRMKGRVYFNATTLLTNQILYQGNDASDNSNFSSTDTSFDNNVNVSTALSVGNVGPGGGDAGAILLTLSIASVSATGFVLREATTSNDSSHTSPARAKVFYQAFA